jgi:hypothetical protein
MIRGMRVRTLAPLLLAALAAASLLAPEAALAHGLVGVGGLPIPRWMFAWAAAIVLVASFAGLGMLWSSPQLQTPRERAVARLPRALDLLLGAAALAWFGVVVYAGLAGEQADPAANLAPTSIFILLWVGVPVVSALFGDVFRALNPWRAAARLAGWVAHRAAPRADLGSCAYPERLGRWPAAAGIAGFGWLELVYAHHTDARRLAWLALGYAGIQLAGMARYGTEPWLANADPLGVYFGLFARLSPLHWTRGELRLRRPLAGAAALDMAPGTVALLVVMIGTTSFDGLSNGPVWRAAADALTPVLGAEPTGTLGLAVVIGIVAGMYRLGIAGMRSIGGAHRTTALARSFAHTLIPIALAYVVAHYFSMLAYQGQAIVSLVSDPLGDGANLLGTAHAKIDYGVIDANGIWMVQVAALLAGHVAGLVLSHDRAMVLYDSTAQATRSQYWMLAVMVGFTCMALWLLSATT